MTAALGLLTLGGLMVVSALRGVGIVDLLRGVTGDTLNPHGGSTGDFTATGTTAGQQDWTGGATDPTGTYSGPNAGLLHELDRVAQAQFHLRITSRGRTPEANAAAGGAAQSWHLRNRAFDASGSASDMAAFWQYVVDNYGGDTQEVFYDPKGALKRGQRIPAVGGHSDHVHVAA